MEETSAPWHGGGYSFPRPSSPGRMLRSRASQQAGSRPASKRHLHCVSTIPAGKKPSFSVMVFQRGPAPQSPCFNPVKGKRSLYAGVDESLLKQLQAQKKSGSKRAWLAKVSVEPLWWDVGSGNLHFHPFWRLLKYFIFYGKYFKLVNVYTQRKFW